MSETNSECDRRELLAAGAVGAGMLLAERAAAAPAVQEGAARNGRLRNSEIETHEITVPYQDWIAYELNHYYGPTKRTIYVVHTNRGLIGLGEGHAPEPKEVVQKYVGTNPFDWIGDETSLGLGMAMYDLMGKAAEVPVYKLFGPKYRSWVPAAAWTVSTHPKRMSIRYGRSSLP